MVKFADILSNNTSLLEANPDSGPTAVFVGGTAGIGLGALQALTKHTATPTIFIVGRSPDKVSTLIASLQKLNAKAKFTPIHAADLTKVKDAEAAANEIAGQVDHVDLLIMSSGYLNFGPRTEHAAEGLDQLTAVRYYSRMRFLVTLAPKLHAAPSPRVVNVLAGGKESRPSFFTPGGDLLMRDPAHYGIQYAGGVASSLTTLFFEELSRKPGWEAVVFEHVFPGIVATGQISGVRGTGPLLDLLLKWVVSPLLSLIGYTQEEAGERVLFAATSGRFRRLKDAPAGAGAEGSLVQKGSDGVVGSGVYLVQGNTSVVVGSKELVALRKDGMGPVVYEHTMDVLAKIERGERA